jgi:hypothetical protein
MRRRLSSLRVALAAVSMLLFAACGGVGVDAGGETNGSNGGVGFIILAGFLVLGALILWFILGRED